MKNSTMQNKQRKLRNNYGFSRINRVFSKKSAEEQAKYLGIPLLAEMPINLDLVDSLEKGEAEKFANDYEDYKILLENFNNNIK